MENGFKIPEQPKKTAYLIEKGYPGDKLSEVIGQAQQRAQMASRYWLSV